MRYALFTLAFLLPASASAAGLSSYTFDRSLVVSSSTPSNAYYAAGTFVLSGTTGGDLSALAGTIFVGPTASVGSDALLVGGTVALEAPVAGDVRALGGKVSFTAPIGGDEVAIGGAVEDLGGGAKSVFIVGENVTMAAGAGGPVTIYANNVALSGAFTGNVRVVAAGRVSLLEGTTINGTLTYQSPEQALIADSAVVKGGVTYTGASYLPSSAQAHALALAAAGVFMLVKILGALILAGLIAGLFPVLAQTIAEDAFAKPVRSVLLTTLLGFALLVATPVLLLFLALTFVGLGLALLLGLLYTLLVLLAFVYTGILAGAALARTLWKRETILWHDAVVGMFVITLITFVPFAGLLVIFLLAAFAAGALAKMFYTTAFTQTRTRPLL